MNCSPEAIFAVAGNKLLMTLALCLLVTFQETKKMSEISDFFENTSFMSRARHGARLNLTSPILTNNLFFPSPMVCLVSSRSFITVHEVQPSVPHTVCIVHEHPATRYCPIAAP